MEDEGTVPVLGSQFSAFGAMHGKLRETLNGEL